jgi:hypothetical protein
VDETHSTIMRSPVSNGGMTAAMKRMKAAGLEHLIAGSIRRRDEDGKGYDVTVALMEEMLFFPFAVRDDLVDAASRIYDMDVIAPMMHEETDAQTINNRDWIDA